MGVTPSTRVVNFIDRYTTMIFYIFSNTQIGIKEKELCFHFDAEGVTEVPKWWCSVTFGGCEYYWRSINSYLNIVRPLLNLTKRDETWHWSPACQKAFEPLKQEFLSDPVLSHLDNSKPFAIATNASKHTSGEIFLQADLNRNWHPCSYLSLSFSLMERNYDIYD